MKSILFIFLFLTSLISCQAEQDVHDETNEPEAVDEQSTTDPLEGAWELVYATYELPDETIEIEQSDNPIQLKIFSDGHYALVMNNLDDSYLGASAGSYVIEGDYYIETTQWSSTPENVGSVTTFTYRVEGDTLFMEGPVKIIDANGEEVEDFNRLKEVRYRAGQ